MIAYLRTKGAWTKALVDSVPFGRMVDVASQKVGHDPCSSDLRFLLTLSPGAKSCVHPTSGKRTI